MREAECIVVGGASGLSAAGGGDFYYGDMPSFRKYFGKYAKKYGFKGAFDGMHGSFGTREEHWGYIATFLNTTIHAPVREPYLDLDEILKGKDFHILTTNQDTQFIWLYPEEQVSEIQGDHRFFQCSKCCHDGTWDAVEPVEEMIRAMGEGTSIPTELIPRCPQCGGPMRIHLEFDRNFIRDSAGQERFQAFLNQYRGKKLVVLELGIGPRNQLIKAPLMRLVEMEPKAFYVTVNLGELYIADNIREKSFGLDGDLGEVLSGLRKAGDWC